MREVTLGTVCFHTILTFSSAYMFRTSKHALKALVFVLILQTAGITYHLENEYISLAPLSAACIILFLGIYYEIKVGECQKGINIMTAAVIEIQSRLARLYSDYVVSALPAAVLGEVSLSLSLSLLSLLLLSPCDLILSLLGLFSWSLFLVSLSLSLSLCSCSCRVLVVFLSCSSRAGDYVAQAEGRGAAWEGVGYARERTEILVHVRAILRRHRLLCRD